VCPAQPWIPVDETRRKDKSGSLISRRIAGRSLVIWFVGFVEFVGLVALVEKARVALAFSVSVKIKLEGVPCDRIDCPLYPSLSSLLIPCLLRSIMYCS
jgi:hypothetical protein